MQHELNLLCRRSNDLFPIHTNDLLMKSDDAGFDNSRTVARPRTSRGIDVLFREQLAQLFAAPVAPDQADDGDVLGEFAQIARDVSGAAGVKGFPRNLHYRYRSLRRDAAYFSPDEFVQHQVPDNEQMLG